MSHQSATEKVMITPTLASILNIPEGSISVRTVFPKDPPCTRALASDIKEGRQTVAAFAPSLSQIEADTVCKYLTDQWIDLGIKMEAYKGKFLSDRTYEEVRGQAEALRRLEGLVIAVREHIGVPLVYPILSVQIKK